MEIISNIDKTDYQKWAELSINHPDGSVFQTHDILDFYNSIQNHIPVVIAALEGNKIIGILVAVIQKESLGYISSRTIVYGGPLIDTEIKNKAEVLNELLKELIVKVKHKSIYIQFRNFFDLTEYKEVFSAHGFKHIDWLNFKVQTTSEQEARKNLSSSKLRQIKKGLKTGVKISAPENIDQLHEFYEILKALYKKKVHKPLPSWSFFEEFYQTELGIYQLVFFEHKVIGGIMIPVSKNKTAFEWYVCGLDEKYKQQYPSVIATWAGIQYALDNKLGTFDFMGAGSPDNNYGVREFKSKFGGELVNFGRFERINNKPVYYLAKIGLKLFLPILTIIR